MRLRVRPGEAGGAAILCYIERVTRDRALPRTAPRPGTAAAALLSIAIALLLSLLPAPSPRGVDRAGSAFSATTSEQCVTVSYRGGELRRALPGARDHDPLDLPAQAAQVRCATAFAIRPRPVLADAQTRAAWPSTARARAPPIA